MGDMGQNNKPGSKKRARPQRRRGRKKRDLLAWLPDGYFQNPSIQKNITKRFLAGSFVMSNTGSFMLNQDKQTADMEGVIKMLGESVGAPGSVDVSISSPEAGSPYWGNDMSMVVDGVLRETFIESVDANEMMELSIGWVNQQAQR